ncbi:PRD domain-containing protein [Enterococcus sp. RIT-PI-f]|uniref:PRD domain-containing protein n=1 Tax=Enterococcus sp. RIT-PI-f TaxID=1690244 RepID=UPI0006B9F5C2|nr:PRD domain-containing protein [Enterococcus sp. RIT-PI-f]KPG68470.1 hypothetical protein AEQ18_14480 [Enterococcus sp. RIT-PI-f]
MRVKRIFNNNVILVRDDNDLEKMLLGNGIGFNKRVGDKVDIHQVEKIYALLPDNNIENFEELISKVPIDHLMITKRIIDVAEKEFGNFSELGSYVGLADHINHMIIRAKKDEYIPNAMLWEIKKFYPREFKIALLALKMIENDYKIHLPEDEAAFIAFHFITGKQERSNKTSVAVKLATIQDILNIVKVHYMMEFEESSLNFIRFVTHIRFYLECIGNKTMSSNPDNYLFEQVLTKYPQSYECVKKINAYLEKKFTQELNEDQQLYFMLHIQRLTNREVTI